MFFRMSLEFLPVPSPRSKYRSPSCWRPQLGTAQTCPKIVPFEVVKGVGIICRFLWRSQAGPSFAFKEASSPCRTLGSAAAYPTDDPWLPLGLLSLYLIF